MDAPLPQDFLAQAEELIDSLFADIQALRRAATLSGRERRALVDRTFRHAHTLKGTASALPQLEAASHLAHELENLLEAVRAGRISTDDATLDACEDATEALSRTLEAAAHAAPAPDAADTVERLRRLAAASEARGDAPRPTVASLDASSAASSAASLDASPREPGSLSLAALAALPEEIAAQLNAQERRRLAEVYAESACLFVVDVEFDLADFDEKFRRLTDALAASAEIVSTLPGAERDAAPAQIGFRLLCATDAPASLSPLQAAFGARLTQLPSLGSQTKGATRNSDEDAAAIDSERDAAILGGETATLKGEAANEGDTTNRGASAMNVDESAANVDEGAVNVDQDVANIDENAAKPHHARESTTPAHDEPSVASSSRDEPTDAAPSSSSFVRVQLSELDDLIFAANELFDDAMRALDAGRAPSRAARASVASGANDSDAAATDDAAARVRQNLVALVERVMALRMQTLARTLERAARTARVAARRAGKRIEVEIEGGNARVDRAVAERIGEPLAHLLRNAVAHGIESPAERRKLGKPARGRVRIEAATEGSRVRVRVTDDGRGIDAARIASAARAQGLTREGERLSEEQALRLIFRPGFSTAMEVSLGSGRGVGLDAVEHEIEQAGGEVRVRTRAGGGTTFELRLPLALALVPAVLVRSGAHAYALDASRIIETMPLADAQASDEAGRQIVRWRGAHLPHVSLRALLGQTAEAATDESRRSGDASHSGDDNTRAIVIARADDARADDTRADVVVRADDVRADDAQSVNAARTDNARVGKEQSSALVAIAVEQVVGRREVLVRSLGRHATRWRGVSGAIDLRDGTVALMLDLPRLLEN
jgi:two-component system chemotaxis sensor kinase CheA